MISGQWISKPIGILSECGIEGILVKADPYNSLEEAIRDAHRTNNSAPIMVMGISKQIDGFPESEE